MSYDAWGKKRNASSFSDYSPASFITSTLTKRGYTGHEMLDNVGLVNMNGRVYDAEIGRFLSADPFIQFPESTQGFNRYTYVNNNPLSFSDPSGFSLWTDFRDAVINRVITYVLNAIVPGLGTLYNVVQGYNAAGGDLGLFVITNFTNRLFGPIAGAGLNAKIRGQKFIDGVKGYAESIAINYAANIAAGYVVDIGQKIANKIKSVFSNGNLAIIHVRRESVKDPWKKVNEVDEVDTVIVAINGILNKEARAIELMGEHVNADHPAALEFTLLHNPTDGFFADSIETIRDKLGLTTDISKEVSAVLDDLALRDKEFSVVAHSQGGVIFAEAVRISQSNLSNISVDFHAGGNNRLVTESIMKAKGVTVNDYRDHPFDAVPAIVGLNTLNPFRIIGSVIMAPTLSGYIGGSPHTHPYTK